MQEAFAARLSRQRWNAADGYSKTEPHRHMIEDVLLLHQGFQDAALDPRIVSALSEYIGPGFQLVEAKGWQSNPTSYDFQPLARRRLVRPGALHSSPRAGQAGRLPH